LHISGVEQAQAVGGLGRIGIGHVFIPGEVAAMKAGWIVGGVGLVLLLAGGCGRVRQVLTPAKPAAPAVPAAAVEAPVPPDEAPRGVKPEIVATVRRLTPGMSETEVKREFSTRAPKLDWVTGIQVESNEIKSGATMITDLRVSAHTLLEMEWRLVDEPDPQATGDLYVDTNRHVRMRKVLKGTRYVKSW
jgi:hypothetical protein